MLRFLLAGLLTLGVGLQASAASEHPKQTKTGRSTSKISASPARPVKAPTSKPQGGITLHVRELGSLRLVGDYQLAAQQADQAHQDSLVAELFAQADSTEMATRREIRELYPETADLPADLALALRRPAAPLGKRRFRTRLVRMGYWGARREAVESLTCTDTGPLVLALLPATATTPAQLLAGPGYDQAAPLRPLELNQTAVLRLCGERASQVRAYAMLYNLHFEQADDVARLLDYYNRIAVVQE
ncbi:hypothetical protein FNT36_12970 [Hymenobacter setariae]|uniref:Uncharacterized protein n=1 Tax=Hymenobacter setariae TaxID=2594794 RepID=A0A558BV38_9BACT|nr:hypothetical protein [Hymenobacter setariae]TVT40387.1 hypothetical protein FNT36_12970 [Hymenobacter setariae]